MLNPSGSESRPKDRSSPDQQSKGTRIRALSSLRRFGKSRHIVPTALSVQCFRTDLFKAVEGPGTRPIVLSMITWLYFRRARLTIFELKETRFASHLSSLVCRLDHSRRMGGRFLQEHIDEAKLPKKKNKFPKRHLIKHVLLHMGWLWTLLIYIFFKFVSYKCM